MSDPDPLRRSPWGVKNVTASAFRILSGYQSACTFVPVDTDASPTRVPPPRACGSLVSDPHGHIDRGRWFIGQETNGSHTTDNARFGQWNP